jgi:hypothetical protein
MKQLAIMKQVGIGMRDMHEPGLWFTAYTDEHSASLQVLSWGDAKILIEDTGVYDVKSLEGRPCWVEEQAGFVRYVGAWKL